MQYPESLHLVPASAYSRAVAIAGDHAYVARWIFGLSVVDITVPGSASIVGTLALPGDSRDVAIAGSRAYVLVVPDGLHIVDVSDPKSPELLGVLPDVAAGAAVAAAGGLVYALDAALGLVVIDASDPALPEIIGQSVAGADPTDIALDGTHAYVTENTGLLSFDVSDPAHPTITGFAPTPGIAEGVALAGGHAFVAAGTAGVTTVDISNPAALATVGGLDTPGSARAVVIDGTTAIVADGAAGLRIVDISNPVAPVELRSMDTPSPALRVDIAGSRAWVPLETQGLVSLDFVTPAPPTLGSVTAAADIRDFATNGRFAYLVDDSAGLEILDAEAPGGPQIVGAVNPPGSALAVVVAGSRVYLMTGTVLQSIDASDPAHPALTGSVTLPAIASFRDVAVIGDIAYVVGTCGSSCGQLVIVDVSDPAMPTVVAQAPIGEATSILAGQRVVYAGERQGDAGSISVYDVTDPLDPVHTAGLWGYWTSYDVSGDLLVAGALGSGAIFELADPAHPTLATRLIDFPQFSGVTVRGNRMYGTTGSPAFGVRILDVTAPALPAPLGDLDTTNGPSRIDASSRCLFVQDGPRSILVAPLACDALAIDVPGPTATTSGLLLPANRPNPFRGSTRILYDAPATGPVRLDIYDVAGRHLRSLVDTRLADSGRHEVFWDGRDAQRREVAPGVYFVRLQTPWGDARRRITRVK